MTARRPLSAVVIARDEERRIAACLESLSFADEIVLVDSGSTDRTVDIARRYADRVETREFRGFGPQKQAAVALARNDLVLNVDCDERVPPALAAEIAALLSAPRLEAAYSIPRRNFLGGKEIRWCGWSPDRIVRLFDRTRAGFTDAPVHETVVAQGRVGRLREPLVHLSFDGLADLLAKANRYTDLGARELHARGRRARIADLTLRPAFAFLRTYLLRLGFLDGAEGFEVAAANAFSTFAKYAKLREIERAARAGPSAPA